MRKPQISTAGLSVPAFANLRLGFYGFTVTVTLHINEHTMCWINERRSVDSENERLYAFTRKERGKQVYYATFIKTYHDLRDMESALLCESWRMLRALKVIIREAKIIELKRQISEINES